MLRRTRSYRLLALPLLAIVAASASQATPRGYVPRACGFDMDRDGVVGEPEDCQVCDASLVDGLVVGGTLDPDHDGTDENMIYVDCDTGLNLPACGQPGRRPCRTLEKALGAATSSGGADDAGIGENIVCFRGTCRPNLVTPSNGGIPGTYSVPASGSQTRDWLFPSQPAMIVGWDVDGDGAYPPFDPDDHALMDGGAPNYYTRTFVLQSGLNDYYEMGHFEVSGYGHIQTTATSTNLGFMSPKGTKYLYLHDIEADGINQDRGDHQQCGGDNAVSTFNVFTMAGLEYFAIVNSSFTNFGGFWMRGSAGYSDAAAGGPIRVQRSTMTAHGWDHCARGPMLAKLWGYVNGFEFLDNVVDGNVEAWDAAQRSAQGITIAQCARDFDIVNNSFRNLFVAVHLQGSALGACENANARTIDDVKILWNHIATDAEIDRTNVFTGVTGIDITDGGDSAGETSENVTIAHNDISCAFDCIACARVDSTFSGPVQPGLLAFTNNSCRLDDLRTTEGPSGSLLVTNRAPTPRHRYSVRANTLTGHIDGELAMNVLSAPKQWAADDNCFDAQAKFVWNHGANLSLAGWRSTTGVDANSVTSDFCAPPHVPVPPHVGVLTAVALCVGAVLLLPRIAGRSPGV